MKKKIGLIMAAVFLVCSLSGCKKEMNSEMASKTGFYFDTVIRLDIYHENAQELLNTCFAKCEKFENTFSRTKEGSRLYDINHRTEEVVILDESEQDENIKALMESGIYFYNLTQGKMDITIAPLSDLWNFKSENPRVPSQSEIEKVRDSVGLNQVSLSGNTLLFDNPNTQIDFGALAKGFIADRLKEYLEGEGVTSGTINLGGNVLTIGEKKNKLPWKVGIQKPFKETNEILGYVESSGTSVVSSGTYERYFIVDGKRYHHVLEPKTGYPVENGLAQVTILSNTSTLGDGLSTSCLLLGLEKGKALIEEMNEVEAIFVTEDGEVITTSGASFTER